MRTFIFNALFTTVLAMVLASCGVKPAAVDPPPGSEESQTFPRTYPDPATDPAPL